VPITDHFRVEVYLPARVAEKRAHGLEERTCAIVVTGSGTKGASVLQALLDDRSTDARLAIIILGDFGRDVIGSISGMRTSGFDLAGHAVYWSSSQADIAALLDANTESLVLFRTSAEDLERAALDRRSRPVNWWSLAERTSVGILSAISTIAPVVIYAAPDSSFELLGNEQQVFDALQRIRTFIGNAGA
jgi:hypothetical protein